MKHDERRQHQRGLLVGGNAVLLADGKPRAVQVVDISVGGALVRGHAELSPGLLVKVMFNIHGVPVTLAAEVTRFDASKMELALAFRNVPAMVRDHISAFVIQTPDPHGDDHD